MKWYVILLICKLNPIQPYKKGRIKISHWIYTGAIEIFVKKYETLLKKKHWCTITQHEYFKIAKERMINVLCIENGTRKKWQIFERTDIFVKFSHSIRYMAIKYHSIIHEYMHLLSIKFKTLTLQMKVRKREKKTLLMHSKPPQFTVTLFAREVSIIFILLPLAALQLSSVFAPKWWTWHFKVLTV